MRRSRHDSQRSPTPSPAFSSVSQSPRPFPTLTPQIREKLPALCGLARLTLGCKRHTSQKVELITKVLQVHYVPGFLSPREPWMSDETVWEAERPGRGLSSGWAAAGSAGIRCKGQVCWGDPGAFGLGTMCPVCGCVCARRVWPPQPRLQKARAVQAPRASGVPRDGHAWLHVQDARVNPASSLTYQGWSCLVLGLLGGRR